VKVPATYSVTTVFRRLSRRDIGIDAEHFELEAAGSVLAA
jgi:hypothetical protein